MHKILPKYYYFIDRFEKDHIKNLDKDIAIIFREYNKKLNIREINKIKKFCKFSGRKFFLSNNIRLAMKLGLDGVYLPSFNKSYKINIYSKKTNFLVLGSAHNLKEIKIKEKQNVDAIFLSSLFKKKKTYLGFTRFKNLKSKTLLKIIALGGINKNNLKKLNLLNVYGFASISFFNKTKKRPQKGALLNI
ncbi:MAG: thiamine-phosphate pyrophosphorylase [Pelagibacterales bacterium]|nr:thiamine-phosphate pyrophosphorylase [Pelagibacterales bacterium]